MSNLFILPFYNSSNLQSITTDRTDMFFQENSARANGHIFNVGNPNNEVTVKQLAEMMTEVCNKGHPNVIMTILFPSDSDWQSMFPICFRCTARLVENPY